MGWIETAYQDYVLHKQTLRELSKCYGKSIPTIQKYFKSYYPLSGECKTLTANTINLVFDATFFNRTNGVFVFRTFGKNIFWKEIHSESLTSLAQCFDSLEEIGYVFKSFTLDGRRGFVQLLKKRYPDTPIQLCHFHQIQIVKRYITNHPKSDCGKSLIALIKQLPRIKKEKFIQLFEIFKEQYHSFLQENNEQRKYMHRRLRSAVRSINTNLPILFTYQDFHKLTIPNTTNSCDGSFAYWKLKLRIHRGLSLENKHKMLNYLLSQT